MTPPPDRLTAGRADFPRLNSRHDQDPDHAPPPDRPHRHDEHPGDRHDQHHGQAHDQHHGHHHSPQSLRRIVNRLSRIEGHVRGVKTMVQDGRPCPDVLIQLAAVRGAIDRVARAVLDEHLSECIARAAIEGNIEAEIEELKEALDRFLT